MKLIYNRSYTFALPMLDWWNSNLLLNLQLRGCFIGDVSHPELDNHIFLLYKFTGARWFTGFEETLKDSDHFVHTYDPDKSHVMFVYDVPPHQQDNYNMLRKSRYSLFTESFKKRVVTFHGEEVTQKIVAAMYKHESLFLEWESKLNAHLPRDMHVRIPRDMEATSALIMENEVYSYKLKVRDTMESIRESYLKEEGEPDGA